MAQVPRAIDSLLESEELMSWLLFDFDQGMAAEQLPDSTAGLLHPIGDGSRSDPGLSIVPIGQDFMDGQFFGASSFPTGGPSTLTSQLSSSSLRKSGKAAGGSSSSTVGKKRPRESVDDLEVRVKELQAENADLHAHLLNVTQRTTEVQRQRVEMERLMMEKLSSSSEADQEELAHIVKKYTDIYADYGKCRQREQIEKLIIPTNTTKLCLWALQQDPTFFQTSKSPMFHLLSKELELTPEQTLKFQERRERTLELIAQLRESLDLLKMLKEAIEKKHEVYDRICGRAQSAATPKQTVNFLMWITRHADALSRHIPGFTRGSAHIPNAEFVEGQGSTYTSSDGTGDNAD